MGGLPVDTHKLIEILIIFTIIDVFTIVVPTELERFKNARKRNRRHNHR